MFTINKDLTKIAVDGGPIVVDMHLIIPPLYIPKRGTCVQSFSIVTKFFFEIVAFDANGAVLVACHA